MEIAPAPPRRRLSPRAWTLLVLAVFAPVTVLALVPTMFGLQRYVIASDSMEGGIDRGSVVFERRVPVSDLRVGDVITYRPPTADSADDLLTHRIEWIDGARLQTRGDALRVADPWLVPLDQPTMSRVVVAIPLVGYPFVAPLDRSVWLTVLMVPGVLLALLLLRQSRRRRSPGMPASASIGTYTR